ncbi:hypothetical protein ACH5Y9_25535 (plasmid) [Methylomonas sp. BW4-1]|uniref:hypothetical protein n=1 Tax=Methylomonas sp. BW4-1 TaxID=3376685 RepID=UPI00404198F5
MIKEFDLDAPQEPKLARLMFRKETRCITALFERCYTPVKDTGSAWKILVEVVAKVNKPQCRNLLDVLTIEVEGDIDKYMRMDASSKQASALDYLMEGVEKVACQMKWDITSFYQAKLEVLNRNFINEWVWKSPIINKSRKLTAEILVEHKVAEVQLSARFRDMNGNILKVQHLVSDEPNEFIFDQYFGKFRWINDDTVELISRSGDKQFSANMIDSATLH